MNNEPLIDEQVIADYLIDNPAFFERQKDVLRHAQLPHESGQSISLIERQMKLLRSEHRDLQARFIDALQMANHNETLLTKIHQVTLSLLEEMSLEQFISELNQSLCQQFAIDALAIVLNKQEFTTIIARQLFFCHADSMKRYQALLTNSNSKGIYCGSMESTIKADFFANKDYQSMVLAPLNGRDKNTTKCLGLIILASRKRETFSPNQGTLFLEILSATVGQLLAKNFLLSNV